MALLSAPMRSAAEERSSGFEDASPAESAALLPFDEVHCSTWAHDGIAAAYESALLPACADLGADYTLPITRGQFVVLIAELAAAAKGTDVASLAGEYGLIEPSAEDGMDAPSAGDVEKAQFISPFSDTDSLHALLCSAMGIAKGSDGLFRPNDGVSRCGLPLPLHVCARPHRGQLPAGRVFRQL